MRKIRLWCLIAASCLLLGNAEPVYSTGGSDLRADQIENLARFGKIWGFLKYHHPAFTRGDLNWDEFVLDRLPIVLDASNREQGLKLLAVWARELADTGFCEAEASDEVHPTPNSAWITDSNELGHDLSSMLECLSLDGVPTQRYVSQQSGVGNPVFGAEEGYADVESLDWRYRLLALYRFWNIVEYWFPYRDQIDKNWDDVLVESIVAFYAATDPADYILELMALVAKVNDGHANLWSSIQAQPPTGVANIPYVIRFVEDRAVVWKVRSVRGGIDRIEVVNELQIGDVILSVGGETVESMVERSSPYYGASNRVALLRNIAVNLLRGPAGPVRLTVERAGAVRDVNTERIPRQTLDMAVGFSSDRDGDTLQTLAGDIAYLKLSSINQEDISKYVTAALESNGLIIDLRGYPSAFVVFALGQHFIAAPTEFVRFTQGDLASPGAFHWGPPLSLEPAEPYYGGRIVILVDEFTQSQAEYIAMAFRAAANAIVMGSQTAGADGNLSKIPLPGGHEAAISGIGVFYPDKTPTQRIGIVPDVEVSPTIAGIRDGRDEVLEFAIEHLANDSFEKKRD